MSFLQTQNWRRKIAIGLAAVAAIAIAFEAIYLILVPPAAAIEPSERQSRFIKLMEELEPLRKVHYSWPLRVLALPDSLLFHHARLTNAVTIVGEGYKEDGLDRTEDAITAAYRACAAVNKSRPRVQCSLGITYSVWHRHFGKKLPPTDTGKSHEAELGNLRKKLMRFQRVLDKLNNQSRTPVAVSAILFDSERFVTRDHDRIWNDAIASKHNQAYDVAKSIFPRARIEWYSRGGVAPGSSPTGWISARYLTLQEKGNSFAASLYRVPEIGTTREIFRRTYRNAQKHGVDEVTPWIALGSGYRRQADRFHAWSFDWNYDLVYSWQLGLEVNQDWYGTKDRAGRFAPWNAAKIVIFYPEPWGRAKHWATHFIAYVRGANERKDLSNIEPESDIRPSDRTGKQ